MYLKSLFGAARVVRLAHFSDGRRSYYAALGLELGQDVVRLAHPLGARKPGQDDTTEATPYRGGHVRVEQFGIASDEDL